jgi:TonB-linked SusC/RagA family outer membrane protein
MNALTSIGSDLKTKIAIYFNQYKCMKKNFFNSCGFTGHVKRMLFVMKLTILAFLLGLMSLSASTYSQNKKLTLDMEGVTLIDLFKQIESQSEFVFIYKNETIDLNKKFDVKVEETTVDKLLESVLVNSGVKFEVDNKQIIITPDRSLPEPLTADGISQTQQPSRKKISGIVKDQKGEAIPGATVIAPGTTIGVTTDMDGKFALDIPASVKVLRFSFIGYEAKEIQIGTLASINVVLEELTVKVDDVVVVGYGIQKRESVVGAISQVKGTDLVKSGVASISNSLSGRVPGMVTIQQSGIPGGEDSKIYIRGLSSFNGNNQPLVLVDGIERAMTDIDPSEIESVSVLKDASATTVYGVKGGNGVILITSKRGTLGKMSISASYEYTLKAPTSKGVQENSYNSLVPLDQMYRNLGTYGDVRGTAVLEHFRTQDMPYFYPDVDAWDYNVKSFTTDSRASVSASGGTSNTKYFISMGMLHEGDILETHTSLYDPSYKYDRVNFRMNFDFDLTKTTRFSISSSGYVGRTSFGGRGDQGDQGAIINQIYTTPPWVSPYIYPADFVAQYPDVNNPIIEDRIASNLFLASSQTPDFRHNYKGTVQNVRDRLGADLVFRQKLDAITKGLSFKATFSYNNDSYWAGGGYTYNGTIYTLSLLGTSGAYRWTPEFTNPTPPPYQTALARNGDPAYNYVYGGQLDYAHSFGKHNLTGLALVERRISQGGSNFRHFEEKWSTRGTYDYEGRYLLEASLGISGSEQFAPGNRFGYFPAVAIGWNAAKEKFVNELIPEMNNFKVRYSYGESGNDNANGNWIYLKDYSNGSTFSTGIAGSQATGILTVKEGKIPNGSAQWSRARKHNLGIDIGFFKNALTLSTEFYSENYTNILMNPTIPSWFGQSVQYQNIGATKRHGYEVVLGWDKTINKIHYWVKGNYNFNENRVVNMDDPAMKPDYMKAAGMPISVSRQPLNIGYYTNMDEMYNYSLRNGNLKIIGTDMVLDFNGDATTSNDGVPMGYTTRPNVTYNLSGGMEYKHFDFNCLIQGTTQVERNFGGAANPLWSNNPDKMFIKFKGRDDVWTPANTTAKYAAWGGWNPANKATFNASYLRLKSMEVGYTLSGRILKMIGLSSARVSLNGSNLLTYAPGFNGAIGDPENETNGENGNDYLFQSYPIPKRITAAIQINF